MTSKSIPAESPWHSHRPFPGCLEHLRGLRSAVGVALHGSTLHAAHALHLAQPTVARSVAALEAALDVRLFERGARGMEPTPLGRRLTGCAQVLLRHLHQGAEEATAIAGGRHPRGVTPERFAATVMPASLKALIVIADCRSESAAASVLGVSQPAIHRALQQLAYLANAALFQKSLRGTRLTEAGDAMLRRAKLAVAEARTIEAHIAAWRGTLRGRVVVGALPLSVSMVLPQAAAATMKRHPEVDITVVDGTYESLVRQLGSADIDLIVGALRPNAPHEARQEVLLIDELMVICRPGHPCLHAGPSLALAHLLRYPWVVPLPDTPARKALQDAFAAESLAPPNDSLQSTSTVFTRALVTESDHLALASLGEALKDERAGLISFVPLRLRAARRSIGMAMREREDVSPDLLALIEALRAEASKWERT